MSTIGPSYQPNKISSTTKPINPFDKPSPLEEKTTICGTTAICSFSSPPALTAVSANIHSPTAKKTASCAKQILNPSPTITSATKQVLGNILDTYKFKFWEFLQANTQKPEIHAREQLLVKPLKVLQDVFLSVESRDFLSSYIVRDSNIEKNQSPQMQKKFQTFREKLLLLQESLAEVGITSVPPGKSINFWSGKEGQARAAEEENFSDSDVPLFKFLFDCWGHLRTEASKQPNAATQELISLLPDLFSSLFATYAHGSVNVYMSSKNNGSSSVVNVDSAFWRAELYALINNPNVSHIHLYLHEGKEKWSAPIDLKSKDPKVIAYRDQVICLSRRGDSTLKVPISSLKQMINTWREQALSHGLIAGAKQLETSSDA